MKTNERIRVGVVGASGYSGMELLRILTEHPNATLTYLAGSQDRELDLIDAFPHLNIGTGLRITKFDPDACNDRCDCVFVALPSGASGEIAADLWRRGLKVIDLSGDLRLPAVTYSEWYGKQPVDATVQSQAVYGLSEWNREKVRVSSLIANPGCYATAILLSLLPIVQSGLIETEAPIVVDAKSGVSGAGKGPALNTAFSELSDNFYPYKVGRHQHTPEIENMLREIAQQAGYRLKPILLTTQLLPVVRGIYSTSYVSLRSDVGVARVHDVYAECYAEDPFVRVLQPDQVPHLKHVRGTNRCQIGLYLDPRTSILQVFSVIDNLQKGAAGQAVQNFNLMYGLLEDTGLRTPGLYP